MKLATSEGSGGDPAVKGLATELIEQYTSGTEFAEWAAAAKKDGCLRAELDETGLRLERLEKGRLQGQPAQVLFAAPGQVREVQYYEHGRLHREGGPAYECTAGNGYRTVEFYHRGKLHREGGPARVIYDEKGRARAAHWVEHGRYVEGDRPNLIHLHANGNLAYVAREMGPVDRHFPHHAAGKLAFAGCGPNGELIEGGYVHARWENGHLNLQYVSAQWNSVGEQTGGAKYIGEQVRAEAPELLSAAKHRIEEIKPYVGFIADHAPSQILITKDASLAGALAADLSVARVRPDCSVKEVVAELRRRYPSAELVGIAATHEQKEFAAALGGGPSRVITPKAEFLAKGERTFGEIMNRTGLAFVKNELRYAGVKMRGARQRHGIGV